MENEDSNQNIELRYISDSIKELKTLYEKYESKNCSKHDLILATINNSNGKLEERIATVCGRVENLEKEQIRTDGKIKNILVYFTLIGTAVVLGIDILRKRFGI